MYAGWYPRLDELPRGSRFVVLNVDTALSGGVGVYSNFCRVDGNIAHSGLRDPRSIIPARNNVVRDVWSGRFHFGQQS